jgi:hypothetical protein
MKRTLVGLNTYRYEFNSRERMQAWIERNQHRATITEVFINNGYALEARFLRVIA